MGRAIAYWLAAQACAIVFGCSPAPAVKERVETVEQRQEQTIRTTIRVRVEER